MHASVGFTVAAVLATTATAAPAPQLLPPPSDASKFTYYSPLTPNAGPCDLCTGPDGAIWAEDILVNKIQRIDPSTGVVEEYEIPYTTPALDFSVLPTLEGRTAFACAIRPGADGNIYAATGIRNEFVRVNVTTKKIDVFTPPPPNPLGNLQPFNDLWTGPEGMYFSQTTGNVISYFDYATEQFTNYPVPTPLAGPLGMIYAADAALWFCEFTGNKIGRLDPSTGDITEYPLPLTCAGPAVMRAQSQDRYLFFTCLIGNAVGRIDMTNGDIKVYPNDIPLSFPAEDDIDSEGRIWYSTISQNTLNYVDPTTGKNVHIRQPGTLVTAPVSVPPYADIAIHYGPGNAIWFAEVLSNRIGRYQLD